MNKLIVENISKNNFKFFGDIIIKENTCDKISINQETTIRHNAVSKLNLNANNGTSAISIFSAIPRKKPIIIKILEKHPLATQTFLPVQNFNWLVVVAEEKNNLPNLKTLRCFKINSETGITYKTNIWHHPLLVLAKQDFWVIDRIDNNNNKKENLEEFHFNENDYAYLDLNT